MAKLVLFQNASLTTLHQIQEDERLDGWMTKSEVEKLSRERNKDTVVGRTNGQKMADSGLVSVLTAIASPRA